MHKLDNSSELANILSVKSPVRTNLLTPFTSFGLKHLLCACHWSMSRLSRLYSLYCSFAFSVWEAIAYTPSASPASRLSVHGQELLLPDWWWHVHTWTGADRCVASLEGIPCYTYLIRYGSRQRWKVLLTSDLSMSFDKTFETNLITETLKSSAGTWAAH